MAKEFKKQIKVLKQGGLGINIPKSYCEFLEIKAGDNLEIILDVQEEKLILKKVKIQ